MFTFFKILIKAIVMVALMVGIVAAAFLPAIYLIGYISTNAAAAWLLFYLVVFVTVMITLSQENGLSKKVQELSKAFWRW